MRLTLAALLAAAVTALAACSAEAPPEPPAPRVVSEGWPERLSDWGQVAAGGGQLVLGAQVTPYALNTALFSDYALKLRTVWIPDGAGAARYDEADAFAFPAGSVITKTFYYPRDGSSLTQVRADGAPLAHFDGRTLDLTQVRLVETRILVRREDGWDAASYLWDEAQREAELARTGAFVDLTLVSGGGEAQRLDYLVPNTNQCANCHVTDTTDGRGVRPIGPKARHLNRDFEYFGRTANQIAAWSEAGLLDGAPAPQAAPQAAAWTGGVPMGELALEAAARAYIDINCAHCHSRTGQADTSGLYLEPWEPFGPNFGACKRPIAAGRGTGNRSFAIVPGDADASIFAFRMASTRADIMMPELGRATAHEEGVALISAWIESLEGGCG